MLLLTHTDVARSLDPAAVLDAVEAAHLALATGRAAQAERDNLALPGTDKLLVPMAAGLCDPPAAGIKVLVDSPSNPAVGAPRQQSIIVLVDPATGVPEALLDGGAVTAVRTAAASAVATKHLARPEASSLGLIGAGQQAWSHLNAIRAVRPVDKVWFWSRSDATATHFAARCVDVDVEVTRAPDPHTVVDCADIVCTLTPSRDPIVKGSWLRPGQHINVVGSPPRPDYREVDDAALALSRVVVDNRNVVLAESGAFRSALAAGAVAEATLDADLGQVIAGIAAGRSDPQETTLYLSVGVGIQDVATARLVVDLARRAGRGTAIDLRS